MSNRGRTRGLPRAAAWLFLLAASAGLARAGGVDEFKVKRAEVFEFTEKPKVVRAGDTVTITFAVKDFCDAAVAIESAAAAPPRIVRHLACGVLGPKAPEPFQPNSLKQAVVWDGKNDKGEYVDDKDSLAVRVSLGLKPRFERRLYWSPYRKSSYQASLMCARPEGVYVYENGGTGHERLMLLDHKGDYVRTVYPFPADKLAEVKGLMWREMPQTGERLPLRNGLTQSGLLSVGSMGFNSGWPTGGANEATSMTVRDKAIALVGTRLNRLATDGTTGGLELNGPAATMEFPFRYDQDPTLYPTDIALSPDGKWLYLTGFIWDRGPYGSVQGGLNGVARMPFREEGKMACFAGSLIPPTKGKTDGQFDVAGSVAVDSQGRVYVTDYRNDRVQVFDAAGKHLKSIGVRRPALVRVHPKTGEMYVFSWTLPTFNYDPEQAGGGARRRR